MSRTAASLAALAFALCAPGQPCSAAPPLGGVGTDCNCAEREGAGVAQASAGVRIDLIDDRSAGRASPGPRFPGDGYDERAPAVAVAPLDPAAPPVRETVGEWRTPAAPAEWTAETMRTPLRPGEGWRIQVGAFRSPERAQDQIATLERTAAGPGADPVRLVTPAVVRGEQLYRAQMSGFSDRRAAEAACARVVAEGADCFIVPPLGGPSGS